MFYWESQHFFPLSCFLIQVFTAVYFPLSIVFIESYKFGHIGFLFFFISKFPNFSYDFFFDPLVVLFNFHILVNCPVFPVWSSSFSPFWVEKILYMILVFLNLLRFLLWFNIWPVVENIPCALEKIEHFVVLGWNILYMSAWSSWFIVLVKSSTSILIFSSGCSIHYWIWIIKIC